MSDNTLLGDVPLTPPADQTVIPVADAPVAQPSNMPDWLKGVDPEIAGDPSLKVFNNPQDLIKSYVHAQKMLGKDKAVLPGKNSTDQDWKQFYQKIGLPAEMDQYQINKGEKYVVQDEVMAEFKKLAFDANMLPGQAQKVMDWFNEKAASGMNASSTQQEQALTSGWEELGKEWGNGFDKNMASAKSVIKEFGDESFVNYLNESGLGDDPKLARFLASIGQNLREDSFKDDAISHFGMTPAEAKSTYHKIIGDANHPYRNSQHPDHKAAVMEVNKLFEQM
jgi:hypothetical protein